MSTSPATSVSDSRYFQPNFLEKVKIKVHLTGLRYKNTVLEKCILASKKIRRISLIKTRATKREQHCNIEHLKDRNQQNWVHFVGVGGCGLSALALIAVKQGFEVSGSDIKWSSFMDGLQQAGVRLHIGHSTLNIQSENGSRFPNCIVVSSAISEDNAEVLHAKSIGIPVYKRDYWLAKLTENHKLIAVSGTHGKSTTSALLAYVLKAMGDDLMAVVGAYVPQANISKLQLFPGGNVIWGDGPHFVLEADEYDGCFLGLSPYIAVLTNVEWEHVDFFQDKEAVKTFFRRFLKRIRVGGHLIICGDEYALLNYVVIYPILGTDSVGARSLLDYTSEGSEPEHASGTMSVSSSDVDGYNIMTYGISSTNEWHASSICPNSKGGSDYVLCHKGQPLANISLQIPGAHNVLNSLAVSKKVLILNFVSSSDHVLCVIATVTVLLQGRRQVHELINSLNRLAALKDDFAVALSHADHVVVTAVYSVREAGPRNVCGKDLATSIISSTSEYIPSLVDDVVDKLALEICKDPLREIVILTLGAGEVIDL
ncbi:UDP-N-acetylmuramate--L-alanine ligase-like [Gossypium australe]|uniref:UDP-N-acetylmuramate--L-alanine ligase-like n=1 Tax=Gossypium australe TaxID=47621 RepID=A0A5B6W2Q9_9ROSI|nr:UDP-N-acetylmuramate--L-alanine ligase-like [Gossypium australe]